MWQQTTSSSSNPKDDIDLETFRSLTTNWVERTFLVFKIAIIYHDDASYVPHVQVIVNNTDLETGRCLQDPYPRELNHLPQELTEQHNLSDFNTPKRR